MGSTPEEINESDKPLAEKTEEKSNPSEIRVYRRRWLIVAFYILFTVPSTGQWIQYSVIGNIVSRYYDVSIVAIDWTSITFMVCYIPLVIPATYLMDRIGLRWSAILGSVFSCIGSWIKVFSVSRDRFWLTFVGQSVVASTQVFVLNVPNGVAGYWFASDEMSTASALCLFGTQLGIAIGFLASPLLVENHENVEFIERDLSRLFRTFAGVTTLASIVVILFFRNEPTRPPSWSRALQKQISSERKEPVIEPLKRLLRNKSFLILCNTYGIGVGVLNVVATLLNQMVLIHFENGGTKMASKVGISLTATGMIGAALFGLIIDKTHKFKETAVAVYFMTLCGQISFGVAMMLEMKTMVYVSGMFLGFFLGAYLSLGYLLCIEFTYPEAENVATAILNIMNNIYGMVFVLGLGKLIELYGDLSAHIVLCTALAIGLVMTIFTKDEQRRHTVILERSLAKPTSAILSA